MPKASSRTFRPPVKAPMAGITPRGKTPITEALRQGAAVLNANDRPARLGVEVLQ